FSDHAGDGRLEAVPRRAFTDMPQHQRAAQHHGHGIGLVPPRILRRTAVRRLEDGDLVTGVGARRQAEAADETGAQITQYVAVQVGHDHDVVQLGLLHQLHGHVVDDPVLELHVGKLLRDLFGDAKPQSVRVLHDVGLVHRGHLAAAVVARPLKRETEHALRAVDRDRFDAYARVATDGAPAQPLDGGYELACRLLSLGELDARIQVLGVLAND